MDMISQGFIAALTVLWLLSYLKFRRVFAFAFVVDAVCTGLLIYMFSGSYAGMMTGVIGGAMISLFLRAGRSVAGTEKLMFVRKRGHLLPSPVWVRVKSRRK
jgi:hypothetical protein